jgi:hypothetical protein
MIIPVSQQSVTKSSIPAYAVVQRYARYAVVSPDTNTSFLVGERVYADDKQYGVVTSITSTEVTIKFKELCEAEFIYKDTSLLYQEPIPYKVFGDVANVGSMKVFCKGTKTKQPGLVGWDLYFNKTLLIQGCDIQLKDVCYVSESGAWSSGLYTVRVTSYLDPLQPLRRGVRNIVLTNSASYFEAGGRSDKLGPLYLS